MRGVLVVVAIGVGACAALATPDPNQDYRDAIKACRVLARARDGGYHAYSTCADCVDADGGKECFQ